MPLTPYAELPPSNLPSPLACQGACLLLQSQGKILDSNAEAVQFLGAHQQKQEQAGSKGMKQLALAADKSTSLPLSSSPSPSLVGRSLADISPGMQPDGTPSLRLAADMEKKARERGRHT